MTYAAVAFHLPRTVLCRYIPLWKKEIILTFHIDVRYAHRIAEDLYPGLQSGDMQGSVNLRMALGNEPIPASASSD